MDEELKAELIHFLKQSLTLDVETESNYTGGINGQDLYKESHTLKLMIDGDVISTVSL